MLTRKEEQGCRVSRVGDQEQIVKSVERHSRNNKSPGTVQTPPRCSEPVMKGDAKSH
jgi:hypothetical protein